MHVSFKIALVLLYHMTASWKNSCIFFFIDICRNRFQTVHLFINIPYIYLVIINKQLSRNNIKYACTISFIDFLACVLQYAWRVLFFFFFFFLCLDSLFLFKLAKDFFQLVNVLFAFLVCCKWQTFSSKLGQKIVPSQHGQCVDNEKQWGATKRF